jgi:hypothetical protein
MSALIVAAMMAATVSGAGDGAPKVRAAFGNTILSTYPDGRQGQLWLHPGGTYDAEGRRGDHSSGKWTAKGEKVCLKQSKPHAFPFSFCAPMPSGGVGASWTAKAVTGEPIRIKLVKGLHARTVPPSAGGKAGRTG